MYQGYYAFQELDSPLLQIGLQFCRVTQLFLDKNMSQWLVYMHHVTEASALARRAAPLAARLVQGVGP